MKKTSLYFVAGMLLVLMLAGCGNPTMSAKKIKLRDTAAKIEIVSSKAMPGVYTQDDIKHLFLKAFQVDGNGAYHVLPNLTTDPDTILADGGNLTEFPKTGTDPETGNPIYSGMLKLNPDNIGVRFIVWAVSYNDYTYVVAEREARAQLATAEQNLADAIADRDMKEGLYNAAEIAYLQAGIDYNTAVANAWSTREAAEAEALRVKHEAYAAADGAVVPFQQEVDRLTGELATANAELSRLQGEEAAAYTVWQDAVAAGAPPAEQQALYDIWYDLHYNLVPAAQTNVDNLEDLLITATSALTTAQHQCDIAKDDADGVYNLAMGDAETAYTTAVSEAALILHGFLTARNNAWQAWQDAIGVVTTCQGAVTAAETAIGEAVTAGEASGYRVLYHVQADRNWTAMNAFNMTMMEGTFDIGDTGPAGGVILDKTEEPVDFMHEDAPDYVDCYSEIAPRDCEIVMAWIDTQPAAANDHINGFFDWQVPDGMTLEVMMGVGKDMAVFADGQYYWTWETGDNPETEGLALSVNYPEMAVYYDYFIPKTDKLRLRAIRRTISAVGYGEGMLLPPSPPPPEP